MHRWTFARAFLAAVLVALPELQVTHGQEPHPTVPATKQAADRFGVSFAGNTIRDPRTATAQ